MTGEPTFTQPGHASPRAGSEDGVEEAAGARQSVKPIFDM